MSDLIPAHLTADAPNAEAIAGEVQASGDATWIITDPNGRVREVQVRGTMLTVMVDGQPFHAEDHATKDHTARTCAEHNVKLAMAAGWDVKGPAVEPLSPWELLSVILGG